MGRSTAQDPGPVAYGREALSEWGKAARYGARAIAARRRETSGNDRAPLKHRLNPGSTSKGGRLGDVADLALSKLGTGGKLASKAGLGSRIIDRLQPSDASGEHARSNGGRNGSSQNGDGEVAIAESVPVVGSIDIAAPVETAFRVCGNFDEYPEFLRHIERAKRVDSSNAALEVKAHGRSWELEIELIDERSNERIDWECSKGIPHSGVISFHRLAPRLTRVELSIDPKHQSLIARLSRSAHLTDRIVRDELHRFKAFTELLEADSDEPESSAEEPDEEQAEAEDTGAADEVEDRERDDADEEPEDEDFEDDEQDDEPGEAYDDEDFEDEPGDAYDTDSRGEAPDAYDMDFGDEEEEPEDEEFEEGDLEPAESER